MFAKSDKYYIKQFEEETNLICNIFLDISNSMAFKFRGEATKLEYGATLAACIAYILISQKDAAGLALYSDKVENYFPPKSSRVYLQTILSRLSNIKPAGRTSINNCLELVAGKIRKRGLAIFISDFLEEPEAILRTLKQVHFKKNEVIVFHLLDPAELNFDFDGDAAFTDLETGEEITAQPHLIRKAYIEQMNKHTGMLKLECRKLGIEYNLMETSAPFDKALVNYFSKREKMF